MPTTSSSYLDHQQKFLFLFCTKLVPWAYANGYELSWGDAFRNPKFSWEGLGKVLVDAIASKFCYYHDWSFHCKRLAIDVNAFKNDVYCTKTEDFKLMGEYWESLDTMCSWGGHWNDGNHFSYGEGKGHDK